MHRSRKVYFWILSSVVILTLWCFQYVTTINIPWWDDFHGILLPVYDLFGEKTLLEKLKNFFSLNNEHRVVNDRFFTWLIYILYGRFELKVLALLGFINLIGIFLLYCRVMRYQLKNVFYLLPIVFILFQSQYYEALQSLMVPFQVFSVLFYSFLSFFFLTHRKINKILPASIFATLALFSHGNGLLTLLIGIGVLSFQKDRNRLIRWTLFSGVLILLYFWGYQKPTWTNTGELQVSLVQKIAYPFQFLGSYFANITNVGSSIHVFEKILCTALGFSMVVLFFGVLIKKYWSYPVENRKGWEALRFNPKDQWLISTLLFIGATAILMGVSRAGMDMFSRYTINSALAICSLYLFLLSSANVSKSGLRLTLIGSISIWMLSYYNSYEHAFYFKENCKIDGLNWQNSGTWITNYSDSSHITRVNPLLINIHKKGKFVFPENSNQRIYQFTISGRKSTFTYSFTSTTPRYLEISGFSKGENIFELQSPQKSYLIVGKKLKNSLLQFLLTGKYFSDHTKAFLSIDALPKQSYRLYEIDKQKESKNVISLDLRTE
ncbi:MAG: hypothetical protein ACRCVT_12020 [Leadbetterella sp.]